ncbi:ankyrin repeat domain-containing protein [Wolbachia endosymbiont of Drosophila pseudotakahashii]|uniref:ankyrin repeat domain-containing protein n=1 Tax=Wolbachia endosymbiont of Drosophila pseudotakahashii TaxID=375919 RepID=UPI00224FB483|nr:ankyrin repeat domain-containing protein [Wolbachia endosymbiont of Drosophila pseudotakahashii]MCX3064435.1 ankyrin repeat domain-containing protein [Wolbachia endosymbiont of Drosophila pseudotakahashii]
MLALACLLCNVYMLHDSINMEGKMDFSQYVEGDALALSHTTINTSELVIFLRSRTYITKLSLRYCSIDDTDAEVLAGGNLSHLTLLNLSSNNIGDRGAENLAKDNLLNLTSLDLQFNKISDGGAEALADGNLSNLTSLNLQSNNIGDGGAEALADGNLSNLTSLNLQSNNIGDGGAEALANGNLSNLTSLNLSGNNIGDEGAEALANSKLLGCTKINLDGNNIGDKGVEALANSKLLGYTKINLDGNIGGQGPNGLVEFLAGGKALTLALLNSDGNNISNNMKDLVNVPRNRQGWTSLHYAVKNGNVGKINDLIKGGKNVDAQDEQGWTPLHLAATGSYTKVVNAQMYGDDIHARETGSEEPIYIKACKNIIESFLDKLLNIKVVGALIKGKAEINAKDRQGRTPLHWAASKGGIEVVNALIEKGSDVNAVNKYGNAPLRFAARDGHIDIVKALIQGGANVNARNSDGTPLHTAYGHEEIVKLLIGKGADVNAVNSNGDTPLRFADRNGHIDTVKALINYVTKLEAADLYVSQKNLEEKNRLIGDLHDLHSSYPQHLQNCKKEVKKIEKESQELHSFLKKSDINELISVWERNADIQNQIDNHDNLKEQYPEYAHILINKANEVKKEIFLHNHKPLIDALSAHYKCDIKTMTFAGIENFFKVVHRDDFKEKLGNGGITLKNFVDLKNVEKRDDVPKLGVIAFKHGCQLSEPRVTRVIDQALSL